MALQVLPCNCKQISENDDEFSSKSQPHLNPIPILRGIREAYRQAFVETAIPEIESVYEYINIHRSTYLFIQVERIVMDVFQAVCSQIDKKVVSGVKAFVISNRAQFSECIRDMLLFGITALRETAPSAQPRDVEGLLRSHYQRVSHKLTSHGSKRKKTDDTESEAVTYDEFYMLYEGGFTVNDISDEKLPTEKSAVETRHIENVTLQLFDRTHVLPNGTLHFTSIPAVKQRETEEDYIRRGTIFYVRTTNCLPACVGATYPVLLFNRLLAFGLRRELINSRATLLLNPKRHGDMDEDWRSGQGEQRDFITALKVAQENAEERRAMDSVLTEHGAPGAEHESTPEQERMAMNFECSITKVATPFRHLTSDNMAPRIVSSIQEMIQTYYGIFTSPNTSSRFGEGESTSLFKKMDVEATLRQYVFPLVQLLLSVMRIKPDKVDEALVLVSRDIELTIREHDPRLGDAPPAGGSTSASGVPPVPSIPKW